MSEYFNPSTEPEPEIVMQLIRELTATITNWANYSQLGISNPQLGIIYPIGDWEYMSLVMKSQRKNHQSPIEENNTNW